MTKPLLILVATMSGTAEMVADEIANRIEDADDEAKIVRMEKATVATVAAAERVIICTSTYGTGEVPDNGKPLLAALEAERPDLSHLKFGVVGLGDSVYPQTFCFGGRRFEDAFIALGAKTVIDRLDLDARSKVYPEDAGGEWAEHWLRTAGD